MGIILIGIGILVWTGLMIKFNRNEIKKEIAAAKKRKKK
jgi:hypothetical protein